MKKFLALALALMMVFALAACGKKEPNPSGNGTSDPDTSQQEPTNTPDPGTDEPSDTPDDNSGEVSVPKGVAIPTDKYPYLNSLVLPDNAAVTEVDDSYYEMGAMVTMIVKPMNQDKVDAYLEKLKAEGYTEGDHCLVSPDGNLELIVGVMMLEMGYIDLSAYDRTE